MKNLIFDSEFEECKEYGLTFWQCPVFLFLIVGIIDIASMLGVYIIVKSYEIPELVVFSVSAVSILIFSVGVSIVSGVRHIVEANRTKSEFISIASHQLKAPLSGMRWTVDLLLSNRFGDLNKKQEEYIKDIQENNTRMIRIVNDLLDVSRIDSGKMVMNIQEVDLGEIITNTVEELEFFAVANNTDIAVDIGRKLNKVEADPLRVKMVVQNFIDNAIKYIGDQKRGLVKITLKNDGENVYCSVTDNGIGISKEDQKKIFEKFFRGNTIARRQTVGSGLGLYIAKVSIENSKGKINFKSKEGEGSVFWFTLPACK